MVTLAVVVAAVGAVGCAGRCGGRVTAAGAGTAAGAAAATWTRGPATDTSVGASSSAAVTRERARCCWPANTPGIRRGTGVRRNPETSSTATAIANWPQASQATAASTSITTRSVTAPASRSFAPPSGSPIVVASNSGRPQTRASSIKTAPSACRRRISHPPVVVPSNATAVAVAPPCTSSIPTAERIAVGLEACAVTVTVFPATDTL